MSKLGRKTELGLIAGDEATRQVKLSQNGTGGHRVLSRIQITGILQRVEWSGVEFLQWTQFKGLST